MSTRWAAHRLEKKGIRVVLTRSGPEPHVTLPSMKAQSTWPWRSAGRERAHSWRHRQGFVHAGSQPRAVSSIAAGAGPVGPGGSPVETGVGCGPLGEG